MAEKKKKGFLDGYKTYDINKEGLGTPEQWKKSFNKRMSFEEAKEFLQDSDPMVIIGVKQGATNDEIKKAFRKLVNLHHPDRNQHRVVEATELLKKINAAYVILKKMFDIK